MHFLFLGILLGLGAAIPIGPINLEIIRRNLRYGTHYGIMLGLGACGADVTYLILLCLGALTLLQYPDVLRTLGFIGSFILAWFGFNAFRFVPIEQSITPLSPSLIRYGLEGYAITLINPYTILFWASISSQITAIGHGNSVILAGLGVVVGTVGWVIFLNGTLHFTRHRLNPRVIKWLNYSGGIILFIFAGMGMVRALGFG